MIFLSAFLCSFCELETLFFGDHKYYLRPDNPNV